MGHLYSTHLTFQEFFAVLWESDIFRFLVFFAHVKGNLLPMFNETEEKQNDQNITLTIMCMSLLFIFGLVVILCYPLALRLLNSIKRPDLAVGFFFFFLQN